MKTIIAGSRTITDYAYVEKTIEDCISVYGSNITEVVSGGAPGVDTLGAQWAKKNKIKPKEFLAKWKKYGLAAGGIRNGKMAEYGDMLIAIWDGTSTGTKDMIKQAKNKSLIVHVIRTDKTSISDFFR
ncbi:MAG: DUF2493 domain-containing protein [Candidatus Peribacteraceae bacterium]|nr:DUF2493 domain-containing protein [Candidatus Peribacteraceae bacterium]